VLRVAYAPVGQQDTMADLERQLNDAVAQAACAFLHPDGGTTSEAILRVLSDTCRLLGAEQSVCYEMNEERTAATAFTETRDHEHLPYSLGAVYPVDEIPIMFEALLRGDFAIAYASEETPAFPLLKHFMMLEELACALIVPVLEAGALRYVVTFRFHREPDKLTAAVLQAVQRLSNVVGMAFSRQKTADSLEQVEAKMRQKQRLESLGVLAGGLAHDLNNNLLVIRGSLDLLGMSDTDAERDECLSEIGEAVDSAADLIRRVLVFSREAVKPREAVQLSTVLGGLLSMAHRLLPDSLVVDADGLDLEGMVPVSRTELEQAVFNLLTNASHAMGDAGTVQLRVQVDDEAARALGVPQAATFTVVDTGVGMSEEQVERACDPFFTTKGVDQGTGLGLAVVFGMVKSAGGTLRIDSAEGQGTTVSFSLPLVKAPPVAPSTEEITSMKGQESVLLVEDHAVVRRVAQNVLRRAGYTVTVAEDGEDALQMLTSGATFDVVVSDVVMPHRGGASLFYEARKRAPQLPFVFCSGYTAGQVDNAILDDDRTHFLAKPYRAPKLLRAIRLLLDAPEQSPSTVG